MKNFWDKEYKKSRRQSGASGHLALSDKPSEDLIKFTKWLPRNADPNPLRPEASVLDLGCGNGRNLIYLAKTHGLSGLGYDISSEAVSQAKKLSKNFNLQYQVRGIAGQWDLPDQSQDFVLDMMTSHFLTQKEREELLKEIVRVLKPGGWLYLKTFLRDEDTHAERLLRKYPTEESGTYIHPKIGAAEHVSTEEEIKETLNKDFIVRKMLRSHKTGKRRSISVYAEKI